MSQKEANKINMILGVITCAIAVAITISALMNNIGHLISAVIVFTIGFEAKFVSAEDADEFDLR